MSDSDLLPSSHARLLLECGLDEQTCEPGLVLDERGMRFISRWQFTLGTQLAIACESQDSIRGRTKVRLEGIVVWSERLARSGSPAFDTTVLFLEVPQEDVGAIADLGMRIAG